MQVVLGERREAEADSGVRGEWGFDCFIRCSGGSRTCRIHRLRGDFLG